MLSISPWTAVAEIPATDRPQQSYIRATDFDTYTLDADRIRASLTSNAPTELALPNPDGGLDWFSVVETSIMAPELAAMFPEIKTFRGQGIDNPAATVSLDITPAGFHAQVLSPDGAYYIDPYYHLDDSLYAIYAAENTYLVPEFTECVADCGCEDDHDDDDQDAEHAAAHLEAGPSAMSDDCGCEANGDAHPVAEPVAAAGALVGEAPSVQAAAADSSAARSGEVLRTYRIAVAATGEYTAFHGGTVELGQAAIVTAINRVSGIYETELSIKLELIANNDLLVHTNAAADPYSNDNPLALLSQNQATIDSVIGSANYDVGHVFSTGGGGLAALGVVGVNGQKARGETGLGNPIGDVFYVDYVAHELGHQFGAHHTFNGDSGSCSGGNRNASTAYEPGSGSTIMAYAGICGNDDLQSNSDPYFHSASFDQIINFVDNTIPSVGTRTPTGNSVPTVDAGSDFTIPAQTPFILTASGSDADGDVLTYSWEERDLGPQRDVNAPDNGSSPLFRAFVPTTSPSRTFTRLPELLDNTTVIGEKLPTTTRTMNFRVTARDNRAGGGGVNTDNMSVSVVNTGAAFAVTTPNSAISWPALSTQAVTWNVAGTTGSGINTAFVNILLSTDGGNTFSTVLASNTPNDGTQDIVVPAVVASTARIKVEAVGNIFFDISDANFTITASVPGIDLLGTVFDIEPANLLIAAGQTSASFTVNNQGDVPSGAFDVKFYLSDDNVIDSSSDILLTLDSSDPNYDVSEPSAYHLPGGLDALLSHSGTVTLAVPLGDPFGTDGDYYLGMIVDADADVSEIDESNNLNRGEGFDTQGVEYIDNIAAFPFFEGWEDGTTFAPWWDVVPGVEGRIQITTANAPYQGAYHVTLDDTTDAAQLSLNQLILHINLAGQTGVRLQFANKEFNDEDNAQDSVDISVDGGANWYQVVPLTGSNSTPAYTRRTYLLDSLGLTYTSDTMIRFQQYDDYAIATDGMAFDDIRLDVAPIVSEFYAEDLSGDPGWSTEGEWAFGQPAGLGGIDNGNEDPSSGATGPNVYGVDLNGDYNLTIGGPFYLTTSPIDTTGYANVTLAFQRWLNTDYPNFVFATVDVSNDGAAWTNVFTNVSGTPITDSSWQSLEYDISSVADNQSTLYIRWGYQIGSGAFAYSGWNIDDVRLLGTAIAPPPGMPGDYNDDGTVDTADYVLYRKYEGTDTILPNDLVGGTIRQDHFEQWKSHFGQSTPGGRGEVVSSIGSLPAMAANHDAAVLRLDARAEQAARLDWKFAGLVIDSTTRSNTPQRSHLVGTVLPAALFGDAERDSALMDWVATRVSNVPASVRESDVYTGWSLYEESAAAEFGVIDSALEKLLAGVA